MTRAVQARALCMIAQYQTKTRTQINYARMYRIGNRPIENEFTSVISVISDHVERAMKILPLG